MGGFRHRDGPASITAGLHARRIGTEAGCYKVHLGDDSAATRSASFVLLDGATANPTKRQ